MYAHPSSIVGSIGVVSHDIGVVDLMKTIGIEDRTMFAGKSKVGNAPWAEVNPEEKLKKQEHLKEIHVQFTDLVKKARGWTSAPLEGGILTDELEEGISLSLNDALLEEAPLLEGGPQDAADCVRILSLEEEEELFNADCWSGNRAVELGLIDGTCAGFTDGIVDSIVKSGILKAEFEAEVRELEAAQGISLSLNDDAQEEEEALPLLEERHLEMVKSENVLGGGGSVSPVSVVQMPSPQECVAVAASSFAQTLLSEAKREIACLPYAI